ncbi:putative quinol monooxygenase [Desulfosporosinus sp. OT]|uniref:putative quinol monooxygenase n=1 Tax=Desulfosporosinus sp. OT TaxID=913865 RepID=UPI000223AD00|nr:putative quinol monooxygenase [Desulfosporosinus sp. OT]EGW41786.1 antibiotic biosynthesis monooxygenase family protein [Desulfosporosinus sp. OT]
MLTLLATLKVKPGKEAEVTEICTQLAKEVLSKEKDCLMYIPHVVKNDPTEIVFFEKYKDKEAFKAHGSSAYFQAAAQKFEDLLEGKIQVKFLEEV